MEIKQGELATQLNLFLAVSKKGMRQIAKEIGITHFALNGFIHETRETSYRTKLKIQYYLDKELPKEQK